MTARESIWKDMKKKKKQICFFMGLRKAHGAESGNTREH
jgi:hypothetical protein